MPTKKTVKKTKNVLIISASFRPNSNSHVLCQEVAKGVKAAGNKAEVVRLKDKNIGFCTGCYACQKLGKCVIKDDANAIVEKICRADAVVFGTPVYYFSIAGQLKALFDRCVAKWPEPNGKPYYLVATMAENRDAGGDGRVPRALRGTRSLGASRQDVLRDHRARWKEDETI